MNSRRLWNRSSQRRKSGFTLVEVLVATAVTLLMMVSLAKIFKIIGDSMQEGRATLELNNRLRNVALRIKQDLTNATAITRPPADPSQGLGYFKFYDGPLTDYFPRSYSDALNSDADPTNDVQDLSRFGDTDDSAMWTARADEVWYTGKVPLCVLQGVAPDATNTQEYVTIASQYAEIALFLEPVVTNVDNPTLSPGPLIADPNLYQTVPGTDFPAQYRLHYRTLLIRPDLNVSGSLVGGNVAGGDNWLMALPGEVDVGGTVGIVSLPTPTCDMAKAHQQCDLSLRRVSPTGSAVAANSLTDLANPANRFAHVQIPLPANTFSMPVLALSPRMDTSNSPMDFTAFEPTSNDPTSPLYFQSGFLHPAFTLIGDRAGEDVLATDILAFDVRGFDPGAPTISSPGADGSPGIAGVDDDLGGMAGSASELGWPGTDDAILTPGDYGFGVTLAAGAPVISTGEYVDAGWGMKTRINANDLSLALNGQLCGLASSTNPQAVPFPFSNELYKSGLAVQNSAIGTGSPPVIYQPSYDTFFGAYEDDGYLQAEVNGTRGMVQVVDLSASGPTLRESAYRGAPGNYVIDIGTDGIDNDSTGGIDDVNELETRPPFACELRGIRISIRMEDPATRIVKQMSIGKEFLTTQ